jgi:hypothetical protein
VALWLIVGLLLAVQVWSLSTVRDAVVASARAADTAGRGLQEISRIPLVPEGPGRLGDEVRLAADEARRSARSIETDLRRLAVLLGIAVSVVPTAPVLATYLPDRRRRARIVDAVRDELARDGRSPALDGWLAHAAFAELTPAELRTITADPLGDLVRGQHQPLADELLRRLGVDPGTAPPVPLP